MTGDAVVNALVSMWRSVENLGIAGLMVFLIYRLAEKWLPQFLAADQASALSLSSLAVAVKDGQGEQKEILMAVRLLADRIEAQRTYLMAIDGEIEFLRTERLTGGSACPTEAK